MSLSKQMGLGFFTVLLVVFVGTLWVNIDNTRRYVSQQLSSHAQDTATSLGLSVTPHIGDEDGLAIIETMMQAIFDRGYYARIELLDNNGSPVITLENPEYTDDVPSWFASTFPLRAPEATTDLNDGWTMRGELVVVSNVGYGYSQLYDSAKESFVLFAGALLLSIIFVWYLTQHLLSQPIKSVLSHVDKISHRQFEQIEELPKTPELKKITDALNSMSAKLSQMFNQITEQSESYRQFAYADIVTGVGNRRSFEMTINKLLNDDTQHSQGFLFIIKATSLGSIHRNMGGKAGDEYLCAVADIVKSNVEHRLEDYGFYRMNGADFALIAQDIEEADAVAIAQSIIASAKRIEKTEHILGTAHVGFSDFSSGEPLSELLECVDSALAMAIESENQWEMAANTTVNYSNEVWREKIKSILANQQCEFVHQPVATSQNIQHPLYYEWFARLPDASHSGGIPMNQLVPASIRLNFAIDLDKLIVTKLFEAAQTSEFPIGMNLSRFSLLDQTFTQWLLHKFESTPLVAPKITLEIPERAIVQDCEGISKLSKRLRQLGVKVAVEHYGAQLAGITHLRQVMPDYLKIDGRFIRNIERHQDNQFFVNSLISIAKGLSIKIIAEMVETEDEYLWLKAAGIDYVQGYFIEPPKA